MYRITYNDCRNTFRCEVDIQDGTESWNEVQLFDAIASVIKSARILNGVYITKKDIEIINTSTDPKKEVSCTLEEKRLLQDISAGRKVLLDYDDKRVKYNITDEECEYLVSRRESPDYWTR